MAKLTPTQGRYLAFIHAYTNRRGYPPAESEITAAMCVSPPSVNQMVLSAPDGTAPHCRAEQKF
jgi:Mn-dependent DtxR family transcriptional regulator